MASLPLISRASALGWVAAMAMLFAAADAQAAAYSNTCTNPNAKVVDGYVHATYVAVRIQQNPANPRETWVCYRAAASPSGNLGGRVDIDQGSTQVNVPTVDGDYRACSETAGNGVPGPHPLLEGAVGHPTSGAQIPYLVDTFSGSGSAWVCFRYDVFLVRVLVSPSSVGVPTVDHNPDTEFVALGNAQPGVPGYPSSTCENDAVRHRVANIDAGPTHVYMFVSQPSPTQVRVCARATGPVSAGGMLAVNGTVSPGLDPRQFVSDDLTPCTWLVAQGTSPVQYSITRSPGTTVPASVCVSSGSTRVRVTAGEPSLAPVLPSAGWFPDPGTPGI